MNIDIVGKTIAATELLFKPGFDDKAWLRIDFTDGDSVTIKAKTAEYTSLSIEEYPLEIETVESVDGLETTNNDVIGIARSVRDLYGDLYNVRQIPESELVKLSIETVLCRFGSVVNDFLKVFLQLPVVVQSAVLDRAGYKGELKSDLIIKHFSEFEEDFGLALILEKVEGLIQEMNSGDHNE